MNGTQPSIPVNRPKKPANVRPTRASLARQNMVQAQQKRRSTEAIPSPTTSITTSSTKSSLVRPVSTKSSMPRQRLPSRPPTTAPRKPAQPIQKPIQKQPLQKSNPPPQQEKKRKSMTTIESLKKRPAWDMRGKVSDLEKVLAKSHDKLNGLYKFRDDLQVMKEDKESERKEAIQRAVTLKSELQALDKEHEQEIENMNAQQRIHHQELEDKQLIHKRRIATIEIEYEDCKRKWKEADKRTNQVMQEHQQLETKIDQLRKEMDTMDEDMDAMGLKLQRYGGELTDRERDIARQQAIFDTEQPVTEGAVAKLKEMHQHRHRLQKKIDDLRG
ncbi:hypothetical protein DM01DRAFT_1380258 [Hesseltinella vesiculosa]|uniref:Uncharacterized protein n=1 Tax=Hesseltinella vesiculosa TaxID=101127 RepID=A0A1X2GTI3_9FUNG|nr:hypothetical protein DM01DRAFT_1380258 [Hesseltinella vesiculosa]